MFSWMTEELGDESDFAEVASLVHTALGNGDLGGQHFHGAQNLSPVMDGVTRRKCIVCSVRTRRNTGPREAC